MRTSTHRTSSTRKTTTNRSNNLALLARLGGVVVAGGLALLLDATPAGAECDTASKLFGCQTTTTTAPPTTQPPTQPTPPTTQPAPEPVAVRDAPESDFVLLLQLMNKDRADAGLSPFTRRADIATVSQPWSRNMASKHSISHNDAYFSAANRSRFNARAMAENVAMNRSVAAAELAFMNSPGHRANILNGNLTAVGLGVAIDERGMYYVTQNFIQPRTGSAPVASAAAPPSRPTGATRPTTSRPAAARPASSPAATRVRAAAPPAATAQAPAPLPAAAGVGFDPASGAKAIPMRMSLRPTVPAANESTGIQLAVLWLGGLLFLGSTTPLVRLAVVRARR